MQVITGKGYLTGQANRLGEPLVFVGEDPTPGAASTFRLSLVIPAWNEQETIRQAVREADAALSALAADHEIIVVDDGSTDHTGEIVRGLAVTNPRVRLVRHPRNLGYGAALRTGFRAAAFELVAFTDADCQFDLTELAYLLPLTRRYDVTCGYRIDRQDPARRRFLSGGYNGLVRLLLGSPVHDIDCALKVFRRGPLQAILPGCDNFFVNTEMLTQARLRGLSVVEVGVHHRRRAAGRSKVSWRAVPQTLAALLPFWWSRTLFPAASPAPAQFGRWSWAALLVLALLAGALLFPHLSYPLAEPDEGRYAEIGREMLTSGNWLVPTLNHEPYYDKPPLVYWLIAGSLRVFGTHEWAARLVSTLAAFWTVLATFVFGRRVIGTRAGFLAAVVLALTAGFVQCGRFLILDGVLTLFVGSALCTAYAAVRGRRVRWRWWVASSLLCGLGVLTKGPVAFVLVAPPVVAYAWLNRQQARPTWAHWLAYGSLACGLAAPWYVAVSVHDPHFASQFFLEHHLKRFFGGAYHDSPVWFYIPVLLVGCMPWSLVLIPWARFLLSRSAAVGALRSRGMGFALLWAGWCVLFFSLSRGKLPPYVLPAVPAIALLLGSYLERVLFQTSLPDYFRPARTRVPGRIVVVLCLAWLGGNVWFWSQGLVDPAQPHELVESALLVGCAAGAAWWGRRLPPKVSWAWCGVMGFAVLLEVANEFAPAWSVRHSPLARSEAVRALLRGGDTAVVCKGDEWGSIPFSLGHDDLFLDARRCPPGEVKQFLSRHPRSLLVVKGVSWEEARSWLPAGAEVTRVAGSRTPQVLLVQTAGHAGK
jgi:dolichol-phosphate mannosyltransferase